MPAAWHTQTEAVDGKEIIVSEGKLPYVVVVKLTDAVKDNVTWGYSEDHGQNGTLRYDKYNSDANP